jgi:MFS family permease
MTSVALVWLVFATTKSSEALGILLLCYTGPVLVGGLLAGSLLDRYDRRKVMIVDNIARGCAVASVPIAYSLNLLSLWQLYAVAVVYGFFFMITLAGSPSIFPDLVPKPLLPTANSMETLAFTVSGVAGPPIAGLVILRFGAPYVMVIDAVSYAVFILALLGIRLSRESQPRSIGIAKARFGLGDAIRLLGSNKILLSTTLMFMSFNFGEGFLSLWLPILSSQVLSGGPGLYGALLGALALGQVAGSLVSGSSTIARFSPGRLICISQIASGLSLGVLVLSQTIAFAAASLVLLGFFSAPLTVWAQTLRMHIIPPKLRGRTFALLRTMMQSTGPAGSLVAGFVLPVIGLFACINISSLLIGAPGAIGSSIKDLRNATVRENNGISVEGQ